MLKGKLIDVSVLKYDRSKTGTKVGPDKNGIGEGEKLTSHAIYSCGYRIICT